VLDQDVFMVNAFDRDVLVIDKTQLSRELLSVFKIFLVYGDEENTTAPR